MRDMDEIGLKTCSFQAELFGESVALLKCGSKSLSGDTCTLIWPQE